jgi:hypothetical protein
LFRAYLDTILKALGMHIILQNRQIIMFLYGAFLQVVNSYKFLYDFNEIVLIVVRDRTPCSLILPPNSFHEPSFEIPDAKNCFL